jgi:hypothetical protein
LLVHEELRSFEKLEEGLMMMAGYLIVGLAAAHFGA